LLPPCRDPRPHGHPFARRGRIRLSFIEHVATCSMLPTNNLPPRRAIISQLASREARVQKFSNCARFDWIVANRAMSSVAQMRPHWVPRVRVTFSRRLNGAKFSGSSLPSRGRHSRPLHFLAVSPPRILIADDIYQNDLLISSPCPGVKPISSHWRSLNILSSRRITARCRHSTK
jgi:hypothetical protein